MQELKALAAEFGPDIKAVRATMESSSGLVQHLGDKTTQALKTVSDSLNAAFASAGQSYGSY